MLLLLTVACDDEVNGAVDQDPGTPGPEVLDDLDDPVQISFWHSMDGTAGNTLEELVREFNERNSGRVYVQESFQGSEDDTLANYRSALQQDATPEVVAINELGTRFMIDVAEAVPVQEFVDRDDYDLGALEGALVSYLTVEDELRAVPFAHSTPMLYLNVDALDEAGLDVRDAPGDLPAVAETAQELTRSSDGQVQQYGFGAALSGWYLEQFLARAERPFCTRNNGRSGRADAVFVDDPVVVEVVEWWSELSAEDTAPQLGRDLAESRSAFTTERVAMTLESSRQLSTLVDQSDFEVAGAPFPLPRASEASGTTVDGSALWISDQGHSPRERRAAWEFLRFLLEPETQEIWHAQTGYLAATPQAYDLPRARDRAEEFPQFTAAADQLAAAEDTDTATGCITGAMFETRAAMEDGWERAIAGEAEPAEAMADAGESAQEAVDEYNTLVEE
ncbi:extracellular solute-binding protein [Lipingzhangella sp. LS1_29]|uniref:Extracellular solute-binding protein n=1 Tax=Lipingzhangella rawalii TaxID=2055835 RepID=A0ABU2H9P5_9ACTN|nr:extracellular solute-binding protein [Lipingzhangella rawalii]